MAYAAAHPERVSALVLYGGTRWAGAAAAIVREREHHAIIQLTQLGRGKDNPAYRELFTSHFIPGGTRAQLDWFNDF